jgi:phosphatidylglycerol lysyltransferase
MAKAASGLRRRTSLSAALLALFVLACGVVNILSALVWLDPQRIHWLRQNLPLEVTLNSRSLTVLTGLLEIALSWPLLRRKHQGWMIAVALLGGSALLHLFKGLDYEEALLSAAVCGALVVYRGQFMVQSDRWGWLQAVRAFALFALSTCAFGMLGFWLLQGEFTPPFTLAAALQSTIAQLTGLVQPALTPVPSHPLLARQLLLALDGAAIASVLYAAGLFFRPVVERLATLPHEREAARASMERYGAPPQGYFSLMPGLSYLFGPGRQAVLSYRLVDGVAIVLRDPSGPPEEIAPLLAQFRERCFRHDWLPCVLSATPRWLRDLKALGLHSMKIGEEALLDLPGLGFTGRKWQDVRTALHRLPREGYAAEWYDLLQDPQGWLPELERISNVWLAQQHGGEMGFTLGTWELALRYAAEQRALVLVNAAGRPAAFMTFIPCLVAGGGWSLDLMRKAGSLPPGGMEYLLATAIQRFQAEGCALLSLSLAPLADITADDSSDTPEVIERARQLIFEHFGLTYNFKGLQQFKAKFSPRWEARYLVYPSVATLPRVLLALLKAHRAPRQRRA